MTETLAFIAGFVTAFVVSFLVTMFFMAASQWWDHRQTNRMVDDIIAEAEWIKINGE